MKLKWLLMVGILACLLAGCRESDEVGTVASHKIEEIQRTEITSEIMEEAPSVEDTWAEEETEEIPSEEESRLVKITISAAGDTTLGNYIGQGYGGTFQEMWDQVQNPAYFLENVSDIFGADDVTFVNLEGPLTTATEHKESKTYCISGAPEYVEVLTQGSVEAVSMGNNHRADYYEQGSDDTVAALENAGIAYAFNNHVGIMEVKGIRIGFVSVNVIGEGSAVEKYITKGFDQLREADVDLMIAMCHWGVERENIPEGYQRKLGKKCIDWGADLVIGHHPHVIQGIEEYQGKYIIYSLGNFCFGANRNPADKDCFIFQQTFTFEDGERQEEEALARIIPCSISSVTSRNDYKPTPAEGERAEKILNRMKEYSKEFGITFDEEGTILKAE